MARTLGSRRALSILEVMIAITVLNVAMLVLMGVFTMGLRMMEQSTDVTVATNIASDVLERIRDGGYANVPPGSHTWDGRVPDPQTGSFPPGPYPTTTINHNNFTVLVKTVTQPALPKANPLIDVTVTVYWKSTAQVTLETYLHP
jgi:Tfp pilus assembly protein PilV